MPEVPRFCRSRYSTEAYQAPPKSVRRIPTPLMGVIVRSKRKTAKTIVRTCFTFAIMVTQSISIIQRKKEKRHTSNSHTQRPHLLIRREAHDIEQEREHPIRQQRRRAPEPHLARRGRAHVLQLAGDERDEDALDEGERRHAREEVERVELEARAGAHGEDGADGGGAVVVR